MNEYDLSEAVTKKLLQGHCTETDTYTEQQVYGHRGSRDRMNRGGRVW